jgi:hypothetical protein
MWNWSSGNGGGKKSFGGRLKPACGAHTSKGNPELSSAIAGGIFMFMPMAAGFMPMGPIPIGAIMLPGPMPIIMLLLIPIGPPTFIP